MTPPEDSLSGSAKSFSSMSESSGSDFSSGSGSGGDPPVYPPSSGSGGSGSGSGDFPPINPPSSGSGSGSYSSSGSGSGSDSGSGSGSGSAGGYKYVIFTLTLDEINAEFVLDYVGNPDPAINRPATTYAANTSFEWVPNLRPGAPDPNIDSDVIALIPGYVSGEFTWKDPTNEANTEPVRGLSASVGWVYVAVEKSTMSLGPGYPAYVTVIYRYESSELGNPPVDLELKVVFKLVW